MDRLTIMRSFVGVSRAGSFSQAARTLGISGSLVSRHVTELERQLGVRLVNRTARAVSLTEAGHHYGEFAERILDEMDTEDAALAGLRDKPEGTLSIVSPKWIGNLDLGDAIAAFAMEHPKIHVRFELGGMTDRTWDFLNHGFDVAFHTRQVRDSRLMIKKVADLEFVLCASPGYLARAGSPVEPADLARHDCLMHSNYPVWHFLHEGRDVHVKVPETVFSSNSYLTLQKAAVVGRGIGLFPAGPITADLNSGALVPLLPGYDVPNRSFYAIYSPGRHTTRRVQLLLDYVADWFRRHPMPERAVEQRSA
jgi:DNA-binding transcriptional LysR family regulator